jgi:hypothetical protein
MSALAPSKAGKAWWPAAINIWQASVENWRSSSATRIRIH